MLVHLRVTVPPDRTDQVRELFERSPAGDLVLGDGAPEPADGLVAGNLEVLRIDGDGGMVPPPGAPAAAPRAQLTGARTSRPRGWRTILG